MFVPSISGWYHTTFIKEDGTVGHADAFYTVNVGWDAGSSVDLWGRRVDSWEAL